MDDTERGTGSARDDDPATAVVTGGNRGIGQAVAEQLARAGVRVALVARDPLRGERARARLDATRGPRAPHVELVTGDLSDIAGVRATAAKLLDVCPQLDILVHNAGIWPAARTLNADGLEQAFATNHLAPFLLNHLLEDRLAASSARVVQVTAGLYGKARIDLERTPRGDDFHPIRTYANTKAANLALVPLFARRWADAGTGIRVNAVHPGVIRTGLGDRRGPLGLALKAVKRFWTPVEQGAPPVIRLALAPELDGVTGRYFEIEKAAPLHGPVDDPDLARLLWTQAANLTGVGSRPPTHPLTLPPADTVAHPPGR
ncbi:retinol dehydrogenase [Parafrankia colletiae]|uniref:Retinol dehydrogenase n=1 Tax=Parafrankia colletiae TaxID=573497 RepID=A0A1S1QVN5_9ACTN|nr:SDR family NAD(P)-dependent oxidoreductase [Parafrankia colletiae]MCK9899523.1 SDR family NAD(P)-dependent oxidoreductase [Frankia sp. Cpl3]OHV38030.1 retinol dehydrogenase [Parafrankia colletiae]